MYLHMLSGFRPVEAQEAVQTQNGDATAKPHFFFFFFFRSEMQKSCFKINSSFYNLKAFSPVNGSYHFLNKSNDYC